MMHVRLRPVQAGDPDRKFPWGGWDNVQLHPRRSGGRSCPAPDPSDKYPKAKNPWGLMDLVGNVWQYTADEIADEHTR